ncbi:type 1 fimbrial protein [Photorhabdus noenieputensis]|uniref:fimbrial protein n=1 Tax=Photorhabdus noenieputensis TaxID=1208607 RepID=UPI001BD283E6|nr:fimbrial protein [Photorhabdus noenieputensis]MBS9438314.1 type 1 fimbrial protein [Photorhabdus noenieputensis]MCK3669826.1 type 1 fimbrial protein [Photorhabdus noenieputensis]
MKKILKISVVAALVMGAASAALADGEENKGGHNATVTITGAVSDVTCDITSGVKNGEVSLGNHKPSEFQPGEGKFTGMNVVEGYKTFTVGVNGCDGTVAAKKSLKLLVSGTTIAASTDIFNEGQDNADGQTPNAGVALTYKIDGSGDETEKLLKKDSRIVLASSEETNPKPVANFNGKSVVFKAYMASVAKEPSTQRIHAPLTFSIAYE